MRPTSLRQDCKHPALNVATRAALAAAMLIVLLEHAYAGGNPPTNPCGPGHDCSMGARMCYFLLINSPVASAVASLGVILIGVAITLGKITWKQALLVLIGIVVMFYSWSISLMIAANSYPSLAVSDWCTAILLAR